MPKYEFKRRWATEIIVVVEAESAHKARVYLEDHPNAFVIEEGPVKKVKIRTMELMWEQCTP